METRITVNNVSVRNHISDSIQNLRLENAEGKNAIQDVNISDLQGQVKDIKKFIGMSSRGHIVRLF